eukprot:gene3722-2385_t
MIERPPCFKQGAHAPRRRSAAARAQNDPQRQKRLLQRQHADAEA